MNDLELSWVSEPQRGWKGRLEELADGYPFEKRRRFHQKTNQENTVQTSWQIEGNLQKPFLAATLQDNLVGWIKLQNNDLQSQFLDKDLYKANWELIQRNRNEIREDMIDEIAKRFADDIVHLQQPAQNRSAKNLLHRKPFVENFAQEMYVASWGQHLNRQSYENPTNAELVELNEVDRDSIEDLIFEYRSSYLHESPLFDEETACSLHLNWIHSVKDKSRFYSKALVQDAELLGIVLYAKSKPEGPVDSASINYLQIPRKYQGQGYGTYLLTESILHLLDMNTHYVEIKLSSNNKEALNFYKKNNFESVSKREHFYIIPD